MFEHMTYETILRRMLDRVTTPVDKREGSIIWDALAPAAAELAKLYIGLDSILLQTFGDTADREYLVRRAAERGLKPTVATHAILRGEFEGELTAGARFTLGALHYTALEQMGDGGWRLRCETPGLEGNRHLGTLVPVDYIPGLTRAELTGVLTPGEDEEDTEHLRQRYFDSFHPDAYGGNIQDYKTKVGTLQGVEGVKVYPVWNGGGTVRLVIIGSGFATPSPELVASIQEQVDPESGRGQGYGIAPIGHVVTVKGVREAPVEISTHITCQEGYDWERLEGLIQEAVDGYLLELAGEWEDSMGLIVRVSQLETRILALPGVLDIWGTTLGGQAGNLTLEADEIPVRGDVRGTAS